MSISFNIKNGDLQNPYLACNIDENMKANIGQFIIKSPIIDSDIKLNRLFFITEDDFEWKFQGLFNDDVESQSGKLYTFLFLNSDNIDYWSFSPNFPSTRKISNLLTDGASSIEVFIPNFK